MSREISRLQEVRHASDYDDFYIIIKEDAKEQLDTAKAIIGEIQSFLEKCLESQEELERVLSKINQETKR